MIGTWLSLAVAFSCVLLAGCGQKAGDSPGDAQPEGALKTTASPGGGVPVGEAIAEADLRPAGDLGVHARAVFKEIGNLGVQVELDVWGLSAKDPDAVYYAQVREGSCSDERTGKEHEEDSGGLGPALGLATFDRLLAKVSGLEAHGGHEPGIPEAPPGRIEQPLSFSASANGTASVTSLLQGVRPRRLTPGTPEYIHLHATGSEDSPEKELACGDLVRAGRLGSS